MGFTYSSVVEAELSEVFAWHGRPGAITRLMPPWQPVKVLQEATSLRDGTAVLGLPGGLRWVAAHQPASYDPPHAFADVLENAPLSTVLSVAAHPPVRLGRSEAGHAGHRRGRHLAAGADAAAHVRLPAPAARR